MENEMFGFKIGRVRTSGKFWLTLAILSLGLAIFTNWFFNHFFWRFLFSRVSGIWFVLFLLTILWIALTKGSSLLKDLVRTQISRQHPSWIIYVFYSFLLVPVWKEIILSLMGFGFSPWPLLYPVFGLILHSTAYKYWGKKAYSFKDAIFSPGAVGKKDDALGFSSSSEKVREKILELASSKHSPVTVSAVYGDLGSGKSSFVRMLIEEMEANKTLYTHISLTETNEAGDFSRLFANRWMDTIQARYPKILPAKEASRSFLYGALQEVKFGGILSKLLSQISKLSIFPTVLKAKPQGSTDTTIYAQSDVAEYFGNISEFEENQWIITIDEIERAKFSEIYRVIEIIERIKHLAVKGIPIYVTFILSIAPRELQERIRNSNHNEEAELINSYLFNDPKNIDIVFHLPPVPVDKKAEYIAEQVGNVFQEFHFSENDAQKSLETGTSNFIPNPANYTHGKNPEEGLLTSHVEAYSHLFSEYLIKESPRVIHRTINQLRFILSRFVYANSQQTRIRSIRFSDILAIAYLYVKYPAIIEYFRETIHTFTNSSGDSASSVFQLALAQHGSFDRMLDKEIYKQTSSKGVDPLYADFQRITHQQGYPPEVVLKLISLVAYCYRKRFKEHETRSYSLNEEYFTTSYPDNLKDLLSVSESDNSDSSLIYHHSRHESDPRYPESIDNTTELIGYSFSFREKVLDAVHSNTAFITFARAIGKKLMQWNEPIGTRIEGFHSTLFSRAVVEFQLSITEACIIATTESTINDLASIVHEVLTSATIPLVAKIRIVRAYISKQQGDSLERIQRGLNKMLQNREARSLILEAFGLVLEEMRNRYLGSDTVIYEKEEDPTDVLYQSWSGDAKNEQEINMIHEAAIRGLNQRAEWVKAMWERYPYEEKWDAAETTEDKLKNVPQVYFVERRNDELVITIKDLAKATKETANVDADTKKKADFWSQMSKPFGDIQNDDNTLRRRLEIYLKAQKDKDQEQA